MTRAGRVVAWIAVACGVALCRPDGGARGVAAPGDERAHGYDHISHEGKVSVSGAAALPCVQCHAIDRAGAVVGRPGHAACFGACHGASPGPHRAGTPYPIPDAQLRVCQACHSPTALTRAAAGERESLGVSYPPYRDDPDHGLAMSHAAHRDAAKRARGCLTCHATPSDGPPSRPAPRPVTGQHGPEVPADVAVADAPAPRTPPRARARDRAAPRATPKAGRGTHARCAGCHLRPDPGVPALTECAVCHPPAYGPISGPHLVRGGYSVESAFSHTTHLPRSRDAGRDCAPCHDAVWATAESDVPAPAMASCGGCHDGRAAFSVVGTSCRQCHRDRNEPTPTRKRLDQRYSHAAHLARGALTGEGATSDRAAAGGVMDDAPSCSGCHALDGSGSPRPPARNHAPCSNAGCHRDEFLAVDELRICGACHLGAEPWRPLHADRKPPAETEFGAVFPHAAHLAKGTDNAACERCHRASEPPRDMRAGGAHAGCTGAGCHAAKQGPAPRLAACGACHQLGLVAAHDRARRDARLSVRAQFRHAPHRVEPSGGGPVACTSCHAGIEASAGLADVAPPGKPTCARCHDGDVAFKMTGHGCVRCHGRPQAGTGQ